jgi:DNA-binding GntR family transcriptional regulator
MKQISQTPRFSASAAQPVEPLVVPTLVEKSHEHLLSMLLSMEIAPGARIPIDSIARTLGISQTPVREALSRLEAEGLVLKMPNVGYRASAQMTRQEINDLFVLRLLLEPYAAAQAAKSMNDEQLRLVAEIGKEMHHIQDAGAGLAYARFADADATLHRLVAVGSGNQLIADTIDRLHVHLHIFRFLYNTNAPQEAAAEHSRLIEALLSHDGKGAEAAMRHHLERSHVRMDDALSRMMSRRPETK